MAPSASSHVLLSVNGDKVAVTLRDEEPSARLIDVLRQQTRYKGVKLGCGEGGCGACAVQVAKYDPATDSVSVRTINSCLAPIGSLDGCAITTAEGLGNSATGFHAIQEEIVKNHGTQCGFCTPGIVMACHGVAQRAHAAGTKAAPDDYQHGLDGNLCRCTGWRSIVDACKGLVDVEDLCSKDPSTASFPPWLKRHVTQALSSPSSAASPVPPLEGGRAGQLWLRPGDLAQLWEALAAHPAARLVAGNTGPGVFKDWPYEAVIVDVTRVAEMRRVQRGEGGMVFGGSVTLAEFGEALRGADVPEGSKRAWAKMAEHIERRIAGHHVRSLATLGGHFALARSRPLQSDAATVLLAAGGSLQLSTATGSTWVGLDEYLATAFGNGSAALHGAANGTADAANGPAAGAANGGAAHAAAAAAVGGVQGGGGAREVVTAVRVPFAAPDELFWSHKVALRYVNSHALVNIGMQLKFDQELKADGPPSGSVVAARIVLGHPTDTNSSEETWRCARAPAAEAALAGKRIDGQSLLGALEGLLADLAAAGIAADSYPAQALEGLLFQGLAPLVPASVLEASPQLAKLLQGVGPSGIPPVVQSRIDWSTNTGSDTKPLAQPIEKEGGRLQASGEATYITDVGVGNNRQLYAAVVGSTVARGSITSIDPSPALELPGVTAFVSASDIPKGGANHTFGSPVFAEKEVAYMGQPLGVVVAVSRDLAERAAKLVALQYEVKEAPLVTIEQALAAGSMYDPVPYVQDKHVGDVDKAMAAAKHKITGAKYELPSQAHFYMEPQVAVAEPLEDGCMRIHSATQSLDAVQSSVAGVLGEPFHKITVVTQRVGGAFGGKATRSSPVAAAAAVAARKVGAPVCHALNRNDDFRLNGGRCPGVVTYDVGFDDDGTITALDVKVVLRAGAFMDLAFAELMIIVSDSNDAYAIPNMRVTAKLAKCNLPPHTIMRSPGFMQSVVVSEQIMEHVAAHLGIDSSLVKARNFISTCPEPTVMPESEALLTGAKALETAAAAEGHMLDPNCPGCQEQHAQNGGPAAAVSGPGAENEGPQVIKRPCASSPEAAVAAGAGQPVDKSAGAPAGANGDATAGSAAEGAAAAQDSAAAGAAAAGEGAKLGEAAAAQERVPQDVSKLCTLPLVWRQLKEDSDYEARLAAVREFNSQSVWKKRGIVMSPCKFDAAPMGMTVLVHVYGDGSILINHGGIEMGQGLATKVKQAACYELSKVLPEALRPLPLHLLRTAPSSSDVVPNGGQTWASTGSESNVKAVILACKSLVQQLAPHVKAGDDAARVWCDTVKAVHPDVGFSPPKVALSGLGFYDGKNDDGSPTAYSAYVGAVTEVEIDVLTGERTVLRADLLYDMGTPLNPALDMGQVEGAFVQGLGMWVTEEVAVDEATGALLSDSSWTYKIPTPDVIPHAFNVQFLKDAPNPAGIMSSKASGEPALLNSCSVLLALQQATHAAIRDLAAVYGVGGGVLHSAGGKKGPIPGHFVPLCAPATPQRIKKALGSFTVASVLRAALDADAMLAPA